MRHPDPPRGPRNSGYGGNYNSRNSNNNNRSRGGQRNGQQAGQRGRGRGNAPSMGNRHPAGLPPAPVAHDDAGRGTSRDTSGLAAPRNNIGGSGGSHDASTRPAASGGPSAQPPQETSGLGAQPPLDLVKYDHSGCHGLGLHQQERQGTLNAETHPELFYPPRAPGWLDQEDIAMQGVGYTDTDWICPTCLKSLADHDARACTRACGTCNGHHPGHFCRMRYLSYNWYKNHGGRTPYVGEIGHYRPSEKDLVILRKKHPYFIDFQPVQLSSKRKREDEDPSETRKKLKSRDVQVEVMVKRLLKRKQELAAARQQAKAAETEVERLRRIVDELQGRQEPGPEPMDTDTDTDNLLSLASTIRHPPGPSRQIPDLFEEATTIRHAPGPSRQVPSLFEEASTIRHAPGPSTQTPDLFDEAGAIRHAAGPSTQPIDLLDEASTIRHAPGPSRQPSDLFDEAGAIRHAPGPSTQPADLLDEADTIRHAGSAPSRQHQAYVEEDLYAGQANPLAGMEGLGKKEEEVLQSKRT